MSARVSARNALAALLALPLAACSEGTDQESTDQGACVPVAGELCSPPIAVWVEGGETLRAVVGTGACTIDASTLTDGFTDVAGTLDGSGICHILATSTSGATDVQDVVIGTLLAHPTCGCATYDERGPLRVLAFSKRQPASAPDGSCQCPADRYCETWSVGCAPPTDGAQCLLRPTACSADTRAVCGCDGVLYPNRCAAQMAGVVIAPADFCDLPADQFACGGVICARDIQVCRLLYAPERSYEFYSCEDGLACRKSFSATCGCPSASECLCETITPGAVMCRIRV